MPITLLTKVDIARFEERLRLEKSRLDKTRVKWQALLAVLLASVLYLGYHAWKSSPRVDEKGNAMKDPWHFFGLIVTGSSLIVFFASGLYNDKVSIPSNYEARCNRALKPFNMNFNKEFKGEITFYRKVPRRFQEGYESFHEERLKSQGRASH
ncbi:hypothetical protein HK097_002015 [Rhizophlyctis rosea]|uniref:Transmembrane protein 188 n=1 Tax=Rhizophlyctis rosea TaxID=64517 RepID=A0AAD5SGR9_9FUNG|nr:hypothetical protein HK097_002015 [Rhizophlyctis rosea]